MQPDKILIDADAFVSLSNPNDSGYHWAKKVLRDLSQIKPLIYLTSYSYGEAVTVVSQMGGHDLAIALIKSIDESDYIIVDINKEIRELGLLWFNKQTTKNARFTDCVNMAFMEQNKISHVFSRDKHYKKNGFILLK